MSFCMMRASLVTPRFSILMKDVNHKFYSNYLHSQYGNINRRINPIMISKKTYNPLIQQSKNLSLQGLRDVSDSFNEYIITSEPSILLKNILIEFHDIFGLQWWSTVVLAAASVRLLVGLPAGIFQQHIVAKRKLTKIELDAEVKKLEPQLLIRARAGKWSDAKKRIMLRRQARKIWSDLVVKNNCHLFKSVILVWCNLPPWILLSCTLRSLCDSSSDSLTTKFQMQSEGILWIKNLLVPDSTYILPTTLCLISYLLVEINILSSDSNSARFVMKLIPALLKGIALSSFFIAANIPSCIPLYWTTSVFIGITQNLLLMSPKVRRFCRIPVTPNEKERPYVDLRNKIVHKYTKLPRYLMKWKS